MRTNIFWIAVTTFAINACGGTSPVAPARPAVTQQGGSVYTPSPAPAPPAPPPSSNALVGSYAMTLEIGRSCELPEEDRVRHYSASIAEREPGSLIVTLGSATFLDGPICTAGPNRAAGVGCNQFFASSNDGTAQFVLENNNDDAHGGHIVERLSSGTWLEIIGEANGAAAAESIKATGTANVCYCATSSSYPFPCSAHRGCRSEMEITLTRK